VDTTETLRLPVLCFLHSPSSNRFRLVWLGVAPKAFLVTRSQKLCRTYATFVPASYKNGRISTKHACV